MEDTKKIILRVEGMTCPSCTFPVKTALKRLNGVLNADVSYLKGTATIEYQDGKVTIDQMIKAIENIGYRARKQG